MFATSRLPKLLVLGLAFPVANLAIAANEADSHPSDFPDALPAQAIPSVESLPADYPDTWIFAHDLNFNSLLDGKILIVDVAAETRNSRA